MHRDRAEAQPAESDGMGEVQRLMAALAASESRFRNIIERTVDGIVIVNEEGRVCFVNPAAETMFGRKAAELAGEEFGFTVLAGEATEIDIVGRGGTGRIVAELRASATMWEGEPAQLISLRDVTDRNRSEERARRLVLERAARQEAERASRRSRFLAEASAALDESLDPEVTLGRLARLIVPQVADWCVIDLVEDGHIRRLAGAHRDPAKQPLLRELEKNFPPQGGSAHASIRVLESGEAEIHRDVDAALMRELGLDERHIELLLRIGTRSSITVPLQSRGQRLGAITFVCGERDFDEADVALIEEIAARAARALDNARLYEAALAANRAKSDFLAIVSHELRTPLNAILGYVGILLSEISGEWDEQTKTYLEKIRTSGNRLVHMIDGILGYADMEAGREPLRATEVPIEEWVGEIREVAEPLVRQKGLEFRVEVGTAGEMLHTDARKLRQIALNLLTNAVKFTEEGTVSMTARVEGEDFVLTVTDSGPGIQPADAEKMFEPFWQAERPLTRVAGGTGLGLTVSQGLARMLGGRLTVESKPGVGSSFTVRVPRSLNS